MTFHNNNFGIKIELLDAVHMQPLYYRNHRSNGQKNLRCFPRCYPKHVDFGFCGTTLSILLTIPNALGLSVEDLMVLGAFRPQEAMPNSDTFLNIESPGISEETLRNFIRTKEDLLLQFYQASVRPLDVPEIQQAPVATASSGSVKDETAHKGLFVEDVNTDGVHHSDGYQQLQMEFSLDFGSWHYGWKGARFKQDYKHYFTIYVLSRNLPSNYALSAPSDVSPTLLWLLATQDSPPFVVHSLRRKDSPASQRQIAARLARCVTVTCSSADSTRASAKTDCVEVRSRSSPKKGKGGGRGAGAGTGGGKGRGSLSKIKNRRQDFEDSGSGEDSDVEEDWEGEGDVGIAIEGLGYETTVLPAHQSTPVTNPQPQQQSQPLLRQSTRKSKPLSHTAADTVPQESYDNTGSILSTARTSSNTVTPVTAVTAATSVTRADVSPPIDFGYDIDSVTARKAAVMDVWAEISEDWLRTWRRSEQTRHSSYSILQRPNDGAEVSQSEEGDGDGDDQEAAALDSSHFLPADPSPQRSLSQPERRNRVVTPDENIGDDGVGSYSRYAVFANPPSNNTIMNHNNNNNSGRNNTSHNTNNNTSISITYPETEADFERTLFELQEKFLTQSLNEEGSGYGDPIVSLPAMPPRPSSQTPSSSTAGGFGFINSDHYGHVSWRGVNGHVNDSLHPSAIDNTFIGEDYLGSDHSNMASLPQESERSDSRKRGLAGSTSSNGSNGVSLGLLQPLSTTGSSNRRQRGVNALFTRILDQIL